MKQDSPFIKQVNENYEVLKSMIKTRTAKGEKDPEKWLEILFKHYSDRMLTDNERIWRTGALFVPVSLAAFAALSSIKCLHFWHIILLAVPSSLLMWAWIVIAENHRAFQQKSEAWLIAIQKLIDLDAPVAVKVIAGGLEGRVTKKGAVQRMRWTLLFMVIISWIIIIICFIVGLLPSNCTT